MKILHAKRPPGEMPVLELVLDGFVGRFIFRHGWAGTTIPLPFFVVVLYYTGPAALVRVHEHEHVAQRQALGLFGFWFNYCRGALKGYAANPMEIDAFAVEAEAQKDGVPAWAALPPMTATPPEARSRARIDLAKRALISAVAVVVGVVLGRLL